MRLTDISVKALKAPEQGAKIYYDDGLKGFGVRVSQAGTKAFVMATGKNRDRTTIGRYPYISLADARKAAQQLIGDRAGGKHRAPRVRFSVALERFFTEKTAKNKSSSIQAAKWVINRHFPKLVTKALADISTDDITDVTDRLLEQEQPGAAKNAHTEVRTFLRWCVKRRYLTHSPIEGLDTPARMVSRERVLSDDELRAVWTAAEKTSGHFGIIVKLLILTGQRRGEIASLKAEWCSLPSSKDGVLGTTSAPIAVGGEKATAAICLPSEITKNKRSHTFPIGTLACTPLNEHYPTSLFFPAIGSNNQKPFNGWSKSKAALDKLAKIEPWTLHDLRRTYATNLQRIGIRLEVIEALLNHVSGTRAGIVGVYNRHRYEQEMRVAVALHDQWFERTIVNGRKEEQLTPTAAQD